MNGDVIISAGDRSKEFYLILDGDIKIVDAEGKRELASLTTG